MSRREDTRDDDETDKPDQKKARYERVKQGDFAGLDVLLHDMQHVLVLRLQQPVTGIARIDLMSLTVKDYARLARECSDFEQRFDRAEQVCAAGRAFFRQRNLDLILLLDIPPSDMKAVRAVQKYFKSDQAAAAAA